MKPYRLVLGAVIGATLTVALPAAAATLHLSAPEGQEIARRGARLIARPVLQGVGETTEQEALERVVPVPGVVEWSLPPAAAWQLTVLADGLWSPAAVLAPGAAEVRVDLWSTGHLDGVLAPPQGEAMPRDLRLRFVSSRRGAAEPEAIPPTTIRCPVEEARFRCQVPSAPLDLRLKAEGFVSRLIWNRRVEPGEALSLGRVALVRGSSLAGWIATASGDPPRPEQRVELELTPALPAGMLEGARSRQLDRLAESTPVDAYGFFQFVGVPPGSYVVRAKAAGALRAESPPSTVLPDRDSELLEPLVLRAPLDVTVRVTPPTSPGGGAWRVDLQSATQTGSPRSGRTGADGSWRAEELSPGHYVVVVRDDRGRRLHVAEVDVEPDRTTVEVEIERVELVGRVRLGEEPLAARVVFGGRNGAVSLALESDEEGRFAGWVPREGLWRVDVTSADPPVSRRLVEVPVERTPGQRVARIDLHLPDTVLEGEIVDGEGTPIADALLLVIQVPAVEPLIDRRVKGGRFLLRGLEPGTYRLEAIVGGAAQQIRSESVDVVLDENAPYAHARLVVAPPLEIEGRVISAWGGVPGAEIQADPREQPRHVLGIGSHSDGDGRFRLRLPAATHRVDLTVMAPGHAFALFVGVEVAAGRPLDLRLQEAGGDLVLDLPEAGEPASRLRWQGHSIDFGTLRHWMRRNGSPPDGGRLIVPRMPTGIYELCDVGLEFPAAVPRCSEGLLVPGGALDLSLQEKER